MWYIDMVLLARQPGTRLMQTDVLNTQRIHLATMNIVLFFICVFVFLFFSVFVFFDQVMSIINITLEFENFSDFLAGGKFADKPQRKFDKHCEGQR